MTYRVSQSNTSIIWTSQAHPIGVAAATPLETTILAVVTEMACYLLTLPLPLLLPVSALPIELARFAAVLLAVFKALAAMFCAC